MFEFRLRLIWLYFLLFDGVFDRLVFVADGEFKIKFFGDGDEERCIFVELLVVVGVGGAVPVDDGAIDSGGFHGEDLVFDDIGIAGIVRAD